jgi:hypothetical protein
MGVGADMWHIRVLAFQRVPHDAVMDGGIFDVAF